MYLPERAIRRAVESQEQKNGWKWKEFNFDKGVLYLTPDAKKLDYGAIKAVFGDTRSFMKEKSEKLHTGNDGAIYVLESGSYLLKEQKSDGKELMREHEKWKELIQGNFFFPEDIHLIDYLVLAEPPYLLEYE